MPEGGAYQRLQRKRTANTTHGRSVLALAKLRLGCSMLGRAVMHRWLTERSRQRPAFATSSIGSSSVLEA